MKIGVVGASGYAGGELLRLLERHPHFTIHAISAHSQAGELITSVHPHLQSFGDRLFSEFPAAEFQECELIFLALPHGESAKAIAQLPAHSKVVDLGADYRLQSKTAWQKYYGGVHAGTWTYGLADIPSFAAEIKEAQRVANPGCYATAIALGTAPAASFADLSDVVVVAASGTTGAGRTAKINLIASEVAGSLSSYKFGGVHQHTPEIEQALTKISGVETTLSFTPILAPMPRGILATITVKLSQDIDTTTAHALYKKYFAESEFVSILPLGELPKTAALTGSNMVHMQVAVDEHAHRLVISCAIDNLGKGAAGQAVQNANLMCGFAPTTGLMSSGLGV